MTFVRRKLDITINLAEGQFGDEKGPDVTLRGLRASASILYYNSQAQGSLNLRVYGMPEDMMNQLTILGPKTQERRANRILVAAGDVGDSLMPTVYTGFITSASADYRGAPEVAFNVTGLAAGLAAVKPVGARSYRGTVDAATVMGEIAASMGLAFEPNGVDVKLSNPYYSGSDLDQLKSCASEAVVSYTIDRGVLAIWPKPTCRLDPPIVISPATGLIGYPVSTGSGVLLQTMYNPKLSTGRRIEVRDSAVKAANGTWVVMAITHNLDSEMPGGQWSSQFDATWVES